MDKKRVRNISLVIIIVVLMAGVGFVIDTGDDGSEPEEPAFDIEYNQNGVQVVQTQGETVDSVQLRVTYFDEQSENLELSDPTEGIFLANISRSVGEINQSTVLYNNEIQVTESLPSELEPSAPSISESLPSSQYQPSESIQLSAQNLVESDAEIESYRWEMGDGTSYNESSISHAYEEEGTYTAELQVTNVRGDTSTRSYTVTIEQGESNPDDPEDEDSDNEDEETNLIIGSPAIPDSVRAGEVVSLDAGRFIAPSVSSYSWEMGDGTEYSEANINHVYESSGDYNIIISVSNGVTEESEDYSIQVEESQVNVEPVIDVVGQSGLNVTLSAQGSSPESEIESYEWSFGDGTSVERSITEVQHTYEQGGTYSVTLTAVTADGESSSRTTTVTVESPDDGTNDDGTDDDGSNNDGSNNDGTDDGTDDGTNNDGSDDDGTNNDNDDNTDDGNNDEDTTDGNEDDNTDSPDSTINIRFNSTDEGYTVESVEPESRESEVLSTDEIGQVNPALYIEEGNRYVFELGDVAYDNPMEIRDENGTVLFSMTEVGELENNNDINWIEQGTEVRFTATDTMIERSSVYASSEDREFEGNIKRYEDVEPRYERVEDVVIQLDNNGDSYWRVTEVTGAESYDEVVPDANPADPNPTIHLTEGLRYEFAGIPNSPSEKDLSLSFLDIVGGELLSQKRDGEFNDDPQVGWVDNGDSVEFTVTSDIAGEFERYHAPERGAAMKGSIIVD